MLQFVEVSEVPAAIKRPPPSTKHARLPLQKLGIVEERVEDLIEEDDWTEEKVDQG